MILASIHSVRKATIKLYASDRVKYPPSAHERFGSILHENVWLSALLHLIDSAPFWGRWSICGKLELKLALACYFKNGNLIDQVKKEIEETVRETSRWCDIPGDHQSIEEWKKDLYRRMEDRDAFMRQVERNLSRKRISRLNSIHISDDVGDTDLNESVNIQDNLEQLKPLIQKIKRFFGVR